MHGNFEPNVQVLSGGVGSGGIADGTVNSGSISSGVVSRFKLASGAANSGHIGSGAVQGQAGAGAFNIASGTIGTFDHASGASIARAYQLAPVYSGGLFTVLTRETISGVRAVQFTESGTLQIAMAAVSGRMPANGLVVDNVLSGIQANVYTGGALQFSSGLANFSGWVGKRVWVGRSGDVAQLSGWLSSGGHLSGDLGQVMGFAINSGAIMLNVSEGVYSGGPAGQRVTEAAGGLIL